MHVVLSVSCLPSGNTMVSVHVMLKFCCVNSILVSVGVAVFLMSCWWNVASLLIDPTKKSEGASLNSNRGSICFFAGTFSLLGGKDGVVWSHNPCISVVLSFLGGG